MDNYTITLRDYFAGLAMQAIIAKSPYDFTSDAEDKIKHEAKFISASRGAYEYADEMMSARRRSGRGSDG